MTNTAGCVAKLLLASTGPSSPFVRCTSCRCERCGRVVVVVRWRRIQNKASARSTSSSAGWSGRSTRAAACLATWIAQAARERHGLGVTPSYGFGLRTIGLRAQSRLGGEGGYGAKTHQKAHHIVEEAPGPQEVVAGNGFGGADHSSCSRQHSSLLVGPLRFRSQESASTGPGRREVATTRQRTLWRLCCQAGTLGGPPRWAAARCGATLGY